MTISIRNIILLTFLIFLISCEKSAKEIELDKKKEIEQETEKQRKSFETLQEKEIKSFQAKYNAIFLRSDTMYSYTYGLQEQFLEKNNLIDFSGEIIDISKIENKIILKVLNNARDPNRKYLAHIDISTEQFSNIKKQLTNLHKRLDSERGDFIFKVSQITALNLLTSETGTDYEIYFLSDQDFVLFEGTLIDFYIYKHL